MTDEYRHIPVLLEESIDMLDIHEGDVCVDATLGMGGHSSRMLERLGNDGLLIGIDQDDIALETAEARLSKAARPQGAELKLAKGNFGQLDDILLEASVPGIDAILFDLGVSSPQIDIPQRGFSFKSDAPLDMRMDPGNQTLDAAEIINTYDEADLARIIRDNSDERWASRIAKFIVEAREDSPITSSETLVDVIKAAIPAKARRAGGHPAKRTFQALRIEVNDELGALRRGLDAAVRWLVPGGRICVISYHSLEDRIVKSTFASMADRCTCPTDMPICVCGLEPVLSIVNRKPIMASEEEVEANPRSRSAKLRVAERL